LGIVVEWRGEGVDEVGVVTANHGDESPVRAGQVIVRVDPRYFRPTEVETLLGDPLKAKQKLGWSPKTTFSELVSEMISSDYDAAKRDDLIMRNGYTIYSYNE
jgi:GDPmannose 4,6-dehydratase